MYTKKDKLLKVLRPNLVKEWDIEKNKAKGLNLDEITVGSGKKASWICPDCGNRYEATIVNRTHGSGCPICAVKGRIRGNKKSISLYALYPNIARYYSSKNEKRADEVSANTNLLVKWECPDCGYEWESRIAKETRQNVGCPVCKEKEIQNSLEKVEEDIFSVYPISIIYYLLGDKSTNITLGKAKDILDSMSAKEREAIYLRSQGLSLRKVGKTVGLSYERIRQIESKVSNSDYLA